jgi:hypothetical protein
MAAQAKSISLSALSAAVTKAVEAEQQKSALGASFTANHPIIMGRWFDGKLDMATAESLATRIAQEVEHSGAVSAAATTVGGKGLEPAFLWHGGHIILGFIMDPNISLGE